MLKIAFIHTSQSHVDRFDKLLQKLDASVEVIHKVDEELLSIALKNGSLANKKFTEICNELKQETTNIICTCSTYSQLAKENTIFSIDAPIIKYLAENFNSIGVAYTAISTLNITTAQLVSKNERLTIIPINCTDCWGCFEKENFKDYENCIVATIQSKFQNAGVVFLAQASMMGATEYLTDFKIPVYSSPDFGLKYYLEKFKKHS